ncbi:hypothetical protein [Saccharolobus caldissimus]|uniref:hypothetical protein n=1 Tax=Saccharolobus caldissimus TaxID=1702097 RepID=UPI001E657F24|nr:hypothetical protein [Saccharolobus caldissimus]
MTERNINITNKIFKELRRLLLKPILEIDRITERKGYKKGTYDILISIEDVER